MNESRVLQAPANISKVNNQSMKQVKPSRVSTFQVLKNDLTQSKYRGTDFSSPANTEEFFTLESTPVTGDSVYNSSSAVSVSSYRSPFSPHCSQSYASDLHHSCDYTCDSPFNGSSVLYNEDKLTHALWMLKNDLLGPESADGDNIGSLSGMCWESERGHHLIIADLTKVPIHLSLPEPIQLMLDQLQKIWSETNLNARGLTLESPGTFKTF